MTKLDPTAEFALDKVRMFHEDVIAARRTLRRRIEEEFAKEIDGLLRKRSRAANEALAAGVPKTRIGRALGTSNWSTIQEILDLTRDERADRRADQSAVRAPSGPWSLHRDPAGNLVGVTFHQWRSRTSKDDMTGEVYFDTVPNRFQEGKYTWKPDQFMATDVHPDWLLEAFNTISAEEVA